MHQSLGDRQLFWTTQKLKAGKQLPRQLLPWQQECQPWGDLPPLGLKQQEQLAWDGGGTAVRGDGSGGRQWARKEAGPSTQVGEHMEAERLGCLCGQKPQTGVLGVLTEPGLELRPSPSK